MWQAIQAGWEPPSLLSKEEYMDLKKAAPSALRGFAGFGCSFSGMWFVSYASAKDGTNFAETSKRSIMKHIDVYKRTVFKRCDYRDWKPKAGHVVYCDPPYSNRRTDGYGGAVDPDEFWTVMEDWHKGGADVFVSEETAPPGWESIWNRDVVRKVTDLRFRAKESKPATEHLFWLPR